MSKIGACPPFVRRIQQFLNHQLSVINFASPPFISYILKWLCLKQGGCDSSSLNPGLVRLRRIRRGLVLHSPQGVGGLLVTQLRPITAVGEFLFFKMFKFDCLNHVFSCLQPAVLTRIPHSVTRPSLFIGLSAIHVYPNLYCLFAELSCKTAPFLSRWRGCAKCLKILCIVWRA